MSYINNKIRINWYILIGIISILISANQVFASEPADFTLPDPDGVEHSLSDFRGQWVIVNFWATWCSPCLKEIPDLVEMANMTEPVPVVVIGIDFEEIDARALKKFMQTLKMNYLVLRVGDAPLIPFEPLKGLPTTFIVSPEGHIVFTKVGGATKEQLVEQLEIQLEAYQQRS